MMLNDLKPNFILKISEFPTRGNNTQIQVSADENTIFSFIAKPEDEYLDSALEQTIDSIENYFKEKNMKDEGFIY